MDDLLGYVHRTGNQKRDSNHVGMVHSIRSFK